MKSSDNQTGLQFPVRSPGQGERLTVNDEGVQRFTLPEPGDGGGDELHGEAHQAVFGTLPIKLLWSLQKDKQNVNAE